MGTNYERPWFATAAMLKSGDKKYPRLEMERRTKESVDLLIKRSVADAWKRWAANEAVELTAQSGWITTETFRKHCASVGKTPPDGCAGLWRSIFRNRKWISKGKLYSHGVKGPLTKWGLK